jgi:AraC-like DNA-binding protein
MPDAEHLIAFHGVVAGSCWAALAGEPAVRLGEGDVVLFPRGDAHVLSSAPGMRARVADSAPPSGPGGPPFPVRVDEAGASHARTGRVARDRTHVVCGFLGCDARPYNPLLSALPRVQTLRDAAGPRSWVGTLLRTAVYESGERRPGGEAVLERMSEMLFVEALRRYAESLPAGETGWLAATRDAVVGRALDLVHADHARPWTVERLCEAANTSRTTLHERFVHYLGVPPMQYVTQWRMQVAARRLRESSAKVLRVALEVGYESEAAFSRAFKRVVGVPPSDARVPATGGGAARARRRRR